MDTLILVLKFIVFILNLNTLTAGFGYVKKSLAHHSFIRDETNDRFAGSNQTLTAGFEPATSSLGGKHSNPG